MFKRLRSSSDISINGLKHIEEVVSDDSDGDNDDGGDDADTDGGDDEDENTGGDGGNDDSDGVNEEGGNGRSGDDVSGGEGGDDKTDGGADEGNDESENGNGGDDFEVNIEWSESDEDKSLSEANLEDTPHEFEKDGTDVKIIYETIDGQTVETDISQDRNKWLKPLPPIPDPLV
ncbi:hypothetical protein L1987_33143 [Smallanthus sonchifolius]|uniref:Uncharacterized protein n=1 Tax=Smallanthus sonchifolius TaxID=185202 RepID=A0ACB9HQ05_9ASTR|nr:hypothetical protein L1987_33143 [Smallanthus sonchifolius]